jgi:hypothetical protein
MPINAGELRLIAEIVVSATIDPTGKVQGVARLESASRVDELAVSAELSAALIAHGWTPPANA